MRRRRGGNRVGDEDYAIHRVRQGQLAARLREETEDVLDRQERQISNAVMSKLSAGETLDPQFAVQQWLALHAIHRFRRALLQRERQVETSARQAGKNLTI